MVPYHTVQEIYQFIKTITIVIVSQLVAELRNFNRSNTFISQVLVIKPQRI